MFIRLDDPEKQEGRTLRVKALAAAAAALMLLASSAAHASTTGTLVAAWAAYSTGGTQLGSACTYDVSPEDKPQTQFVSIWYPTTPDACPATRLFN